jgi:hypothetical protein
MSQLTPCPECQRHVRKTEARCPFCDSALSLADVPAPALPRRRMSRAATFAFGAGVVGATTFGGCTLEDPGGNVAVYGAPPAAGAGGEDSSFGGSAQPVYGAPAAGSPNLGGSSGNPPVGGAGGEGGASGGAGGSGSDDAGGEGGIFAVYGAPGGFGGSD